LVQSGAWKATLELKTLADLNPAAWNQELQPLESSELVLKPELTALSQGLWFAP
jgi:hypothetical protein